MSHFRDLFQCHSVPCEGWSSFREWLLSNPRHAHQHRIKLHTAQRCAQSAEMLLFVQCFSVYMLVHRIEKEYISQHSLLMLSMFGFSDLNKLMT